MKRTHYIFIGYLLLTIVLIASLYQMKFPTNPEGMTIADKTTPTHSAAAEEEERYDEEQVYVCDIAKYKVWSDINKIPIHDIWKLLHLKNKNEILPFYQFGLCYEPTLLKARKRKFCYVHFFDKGILYSSINNAFYSTISTNTLNLSFFRSDSVHFATWEDYNEIIAYIKQLNGTQPLMISADPDIPFTTLWEPLKNILPLFPLNQRQNVYSRYIPVCSVADVENFKCDFGEIPTKLNTLIAQMTEKAKNNALTADDVETLNQARNENELAFIYILLNNGSEFYDAIFNNKTHLQLPSETTNK